MADAKLNPCMSVEGQMHGQHETEDLSAVHISKINKISEREIVNIFLSISLNICFGC